MSDGKEDERDLDNRKLLLMAVFYFVMVGVAVFVGPIWGVDPIGRYKPEIVSFWQEAVIGLVLGLLIVVVSQVLDQVSERMRSVSRLLAQVLGRMTILGALVLAITSGIGEEVFFRGFLQQLFDVVVFEDYAYGGVWAIVVSTSIFGILHQAGDIRTYWPWTVFAWVVGGMFGVLYACTGSVVGPIVAHIVVNFVNLILLRMTSEQG